VTEGDEGLEPGEHRPDYRFSLANERTFLAWIRTSLALIAAGLGVHQLLPPFGLPWGREALGLALVALGSVVAANSHRRWHANERAMRRDAPLQRGVLPRVLALGVAAAAVVTITLLLSGDPGS
jgi:putative membrane protein